MRFMSGNRPFPMAGLILALIAVIGMAIAGADWWLALAVLVLWAGSLWLTQAAPEAPTIRVDSDEVSRDAVIDTLEPLGTPLLVFAGARIVIANAAARAALGAHVVGQDARIALRHPDAMRLIDAPDGESITVPGFTGMKSLWQLTRRDLGEGKWLIELADRTAEADIGRAHTDFVANASHELRTPLASVIGYVETLSDGDQAVDAATTKRFLATVHGEAKRMLSLVEDLMSLSRIEAEKHDWPSDEVDLAQLAARVVGEVATLHGKDRLELDAGSGPAPVAGDAGQLEQLLSNLIDNALKYGNDDAPVRIAVAAGAREVTLSVDDRGPGIAAEHIPHLTRRFYRTDPGRSRASGGTGLGLAIVKHIVERHRARLDLASTVGAGTRVTVTFPVVAASVEAVS